MVNYFNRDLRSIKLNELQMIIDMIERYGSPKILMRRFPQIRGWEDMSTRYPTKREMDYGLIQYLVSVGEGDMLTWIATITRMW
jgi:hypothetical protein